MPGTQGEGVRRHHSHATHGQEAKGQTWDTLAALHLGGHVGLVGMHEWDIAQGMGRALTT